MGYMFTKGTRAFIDERPRFIQRDPEPGDPECDNCGDQYPAARFHLGFTVCLACSKPKLKLAQAPLHKQGYGYVSDLSQLKDNCYSKHK